MNTSFCLVYLVICRPGYCSSLLGYTPTSPTTHPECHSQPPQTLPVFPFIRSLLKQLGFKTIQNHAHGSQSCTWIHSAHQWFTCTGLQPNLHHFPVTTGHRGCHFHSLIPWLPIQGLSIFHLLQFALKHPVYFITAYYF